MKKYTNATFWNDKRLCFKQYHQKMKKLFNKRFSSRFNKFKFSEKRQIVQFKNGEPILIDISPQKIHKWPKSTWGYAQNYWPSGNCKSTLQWDNTSYSLGWILLKRETLKCTGKKCEVIGTLVLCCGIWNDTATLENSVTIFPKFDMKLMHDEAILLLGTLQ